MEWKQILIKIAIGMPILILLFQSCVRGNFFSYSSRESSASRDEKTLAWIGIISILSFGGLVVIFGAGLDYFVSRDFGGEGGMSEGFVMFGVLFALLFFILLEKGEKMKRENAILKKRLEAEV